MSASLALSGPSFGVPAFTAGSKPQILDGFYRIEIDAYQHGRFLSPLPAMPDRLLVDIVMMS
jgi:hypothetical protein